MAWRNIKVSVALIAVEKRWVNHILISAHQVTPLFPQSKLLNFRYEIKYYYNIPATKTATYAALFALCGCPAPSSFPTRTVTEMDSPTGSWAKNNAFLK